MYPDGGKSFLALVDRQRPTVTVTNGFKNKFRSKGHQQGTGQCSLKDYNALASQQV